MKGMDMMLSSMLGIKPDELRAAVTGVTTGIGEAVTALQEIRADQKTILAKLEAMENGRSNS